MQRTSSQHGQVMLLGVAVLLVLTAAALMLFDFHNVLRAKIKVESAQQAAALAGAQWQVIGLNMLGDINLLKATALMTAEAEDVPSYPVTEPKPANTSSEDWEKKLKNQRLKSRLKTLTETQSRISFIVPLLGYMAVQQTAKQNGMSGDNGLLDHYYKETLPLMPEDQKQQAYNYFLWYEPYRQLVGEVADQKCPVRCNARIAEMPEVWSNPAGSGTISGGSASFRLLLSEPALYTAIDTGNYCYWQLRKMVKQGGILKFPWWHIDYTAGNFIEESELMPLGVSFGDGTDVPTLLAEKRLDDFSLNTQWNEEEDFQPDLWCRYDSKWYGTSYNEEAYEEQQKYWSSGGWLRRNRKPAFLYEGPVCAVDCAVKMSRSMNFRFNRQNDDREMQYRNPVSKRSPVSVNVGRTSTGNGENLGVVAKVLGGFNDLSRPTDNPTVTPVLLPVFSRGLLIPSTMPKDLTMLTKGDDSLKKFLKWLSGHPDIESASPPEGTERYLLLLKKLMDEDFIRSGWNPDSGDLESRDLLRIFAKDYCYPQYADGAGWLQQAYMGFTSVCPQKVIYTGKNDKDGTPLTATEPAVPDNEVTELPRTYVDAHGITRTYYEDYSDITRIYYGTQKSGYHYLLKRNGKIQTNEDIACDGRLYCGPGGTIPHGRESGPPRL